MINPQYNQFKKQITNPLSFRWFMLTQLPSAFFAGLRIVALDDAKAVIGVRQKWFNKNPFRSMYFAILSMAAEVSTGLAGFGAIYKRNPGVSMLVTASEGKFYKKATGKILFTCNDIAAVHAAVQQSVDTGNSVTIVCHSIGTNENGETVAEFWFTWSFKVRGGSLTSSGTTI
jgi:hypothetical protein